MEPTTMAMPDSLRAQVIAEVGDPNGTVAPTLDDAWDVAVYQGQNLPDLRYVLVKRHAISLRLAEEQETSDITVGGDVVDAQGQYFIHLTTMYDETQTEMNRLLAALSASRAPATGCITRSEFERPAPGFYDANDPAFAGDPYRRWPRWPR